MENFLPFCVGFCHTMQISHNYWIYVYICLSLASWASLPSLSSFSKEIADPVTHVPHSTSCFHYHVYKDLKTQTRTCISPLLFALQGVSQHDLHQAETRGTQRSGSKPGRHVLLRACDVGKREAGCGEERRPWDCLEEHVPTDLFLIGKHVGGNSHWPRPDLEA